MIPHRKSPAMILKIPMMDRITAAIQSNIPIVSYSFLCRNVRSPL
jgi:hypothetical protein